MTDVHGRVIERQKAILILNAHIKNINLIRHSLAVEAAMKVLAKHFSQDGELWGRVGLLHDADWEMTRDTPALHTRKTIEWLSEKGETNPSLTKAILAHNFENNGESSPSSHLEWALYICDDLTGLIVACCLIIHDKKIASLNVPFVMRKFGQSAFAKGVDRHKINLCVSKLGISLDEFISIVLTSMQAISSELGL